MLSVLHLEDEKQDSILIEKAFTTSGLPVKFAVARTRPEFESALEQRQFDLILADSGLPGLTGLEALKLARLKFPHVGFICVSGTSREEQILASLNEGATDHVSKGRLGQLVASVRREQERLRLLRLNQGMSRLVNVVQELSLARDLNAIMAIVRHAARELTGADGATFVLRDGEFCYYADEDAIAPLWKGQRFFLQTCISGWAMLNGQPAVIEDIYADARIPVNAYRPTFVKSLAMVPIRTQAPIGAIGNYWATMHLSTPEEVELLQALANTTAVAMENVQVYQELEHRVKDRTSQLEAANRELESFSFAVSHDLSAPLRHIRAFNDMALEEFGADLPAEARQYLEQVKASGERMRELIDDLLQLARISREAMKNETVNLSRLARQVADGLVAAAPERQVDITIADGIEVEGDARLLQIALENLFSNAWKYSGKNRDAHIEFGKAAQSDGSFAYFVRDNGAGFEMEHADKLFQPFQRLHSREEFSGSGIGLSTVQRVIHRHGGKVWATGKVGEGAVFYFSVNQMETARSC